jgi:hypothetical protein
MQQSSRNGRAAKSPGDAIPVIPAQVCRPRPDDGCKKPLLANTTTLQRKKGQAHSASIAPLHTRIDELLCRVQTRMTDIAE